VTQEPSLRTQVLRPLAAVVALFLAVVVQLTVVNRLPLPGSGAPDLVLLLVIAVAVCTSPTPAAVFGFAGGLALDIAPPSTHYAGEYALIFCLAAWGAAQVKDAVEHATGQWDTVRAFGVLAAAVVAGEAGKAALGLLLSDPDVTVPAIKRVLPAALVYDLILAPFVLWPVARIAPRPAAERAPRPEFSRGQRLAPVFRQASAGAAPNLRLAGTGQKFQPGSRWPAGAWPPGALRRVPKLRLSDARSSSSARTVAAYSAGAPFPLAGGRAARLNFAAGRQIPTGSRTGTAARRPRTPGRNWLRPATRSGAAARRPSTPGRNWLRPATRSGTAARRPSTPGRNWLRPATRSGTAARRPRTPGKNWLRPAARTVTASAGLSARPAMYRSRTPRKGWLRSDAAPRRNGRRAARPVFSRSGFFSRSSVLSRSSGLAGGKALGAAALPGRGGLSGEAVLAARSAPSGLSALPNLTGGRAVRRRTPSAGWLRGSGRPRGLPYGNWYAAAPSGAWLRRSRNPWRRRRRRLLRMVGVGR
jgi:rod shape-determining protein MreD